jgi:hypothetical protein
LASQSSPSSAKAPVGGAPPRSHHLLLALILGAFMNAVCFVPFYSPIFRGAF